MPATAIASKLFMKKSKTFKICGGKMKPRDAQFLELYETARVRDFMAFYAFRLKDFKAARRELAYLVGAIYIGSAIAGAFAAINVLGHRVLWAVIGAALPVTTTAVKRLESCTLTGNCPKSIQRLRMNC